MLESFLVAFNAVAPFLILLGVGFATVRLKLTDRAFMERLNTLNFKVFFLSSQGGKVLNVSNERCTFLEALAMSGGLDWYTRRDRIGVMREVNGKRVIHYMDPRSTAIFDDEFYVLQQNDIIFTDEMSYKYFSNNLNTVLALISSVASLISVYAIIQGFMNKN